MQYQIILSIFEIAGEGGNCVSITAFNLLLFILGVYCHAYVNTLRVTRVLGLERLVDFDLRDVGI